MQPNNSVLVIDDDPLFSGNIVSFFMQRGQSCEGLCEPHRILSVDLSKFGLVLLDINMPCLDGMSLLPVLKAYRDVPIIIVSGISESVSRIAALQAGADFYFTKPVSLEELYMVCKRRLAIVPSDIKDGRAVWTLDGRRKQLTSPDGNVMGLTHTEARLVDVIFRNAPRETNRMSLVETMTGQRIDDPRAHRSLEVILSRLRTRFRHCGENLPIKASRNVGYTFLGEAKILS